MQSVWAGTFDWKEEMGGGGVRARISISEQKILCQARHGVQRVRQGVDRKSGC